MLAGWIVAGVLYVLGIEGLRGVVFDGVHEAARSMGIRWGRGLTIAAVALLVAWPFVAALFLFWTVRRQVLGR